MVLHLSGRRDGLLLAGLAIALITVFDRSIAWLLEVAHDVEVSYDVRLLPALVVLTAIFIVHLNNKRQESRAEAAAAALTASIAEERRRELERLHLFGRQLAGALSMDAIKGALWRHLPGIAEEREVWVAVWDREHVDVLMDTGGHAPERLHERTRHLLDECRSQGNTEATTWRNDEGCCFLLVAGGHLIGVLAVVEGTSPVSPALERALAAASALVAVSIRNVQLFHELRETAVTDSLTGCVNRAHFIESMTAELRRSRRTGSPMSLIIVDLDGFKDVNDQDGHLAGDTALAAVGRRLKELLRHSDMRCRYGGDEFLVMLPDTPLEGAIHVAEVLRREIEGLAIARRGQDAVVTASLGVTAVVPGELDPVPCIHRADQALYTAKRGGANRVAVQEAEPSLVPGRASLARSA